MRSSSSASCRLGSPAACVLTPRAGLVHAAVQHLMITKDFQAAFDTCERGLESLFSAEDQEESCSRHGELKASFCIVGIQALAELNQWRDVLQWVLQHYGETEKIPAKIMQMCILLYTKVAEQAEVLEAVQAWLHCPSNMSHSGYSSVAELYMLHILLPLGQTNMAIQLLEDEVGQAAFTEDQRQTALTIVDNHRSKRESTVYPSPESVSVEAETTGRVHTSQGFYLLGSLVQRLNALVRLLYRSLSAASTNIRSRSLQRAFLLVFLLYLLLVRNDPALPSAYPWILRLYRLFQQMWNTMFGPYYRAFS
ncbi:peroxisome assembly protein 26 isoform X1 [Astyanax mexicanus]|uniref:peroxisome assembly protein 26 isoform X1 n=1 Tax=Astyanax mexicanus TaxID=7994 RepID=UPI0003CD21B1|nr:peroxisome assembly protein 26 isoform X1 [Astyanax mexicanus]